MTSEADDDSVAFGLLEDVIKSQELSTAEINFLKSKYTKLHQLLVSSKSFEAQLIRKCKSFQVDIAGEKILLEKTRVEEMEESQQIRRMEENRNSLQKELEFTEQRDTMAKFELSELKRVHDELTKELATMKKENMNLVNPIINKLKQEIGDFSEQLRQADIAFEKESVQKEVLSARVIELERIKGEKSELLKIRTDALRGAEVEPDRVGRQIESIEKALEIMEGDLRTSVRRIHNYDQDIDKQNKRRVEVEKLKKSLLEKMELNRQTIEQREQDIATLRGNLESARAHNHDLITTKVELNIRKKEVDAALRHKSDQHSFAKKDYDNGKRQLKKKRNIADSCKQLIPQLEEKLRDQEVLVQTFKDEEERNAKTLLKLKHEVEAHLAQFLEQEDMEGDKKRALEKALLEVDDMEAGVLHWLAEGKRQGKLLAVLSAQRDIKGRECARIEQKEKEAKNHVKIKELVILDLTKRCNEISNRLKEFSALYEVVKNERNKYVNLIQSSTQALAEMREKIRILHNEVEILGNESTAKDIALTKERAAHQHAQNQRDGLRQDMNRLLSEYRTKQSVVEQQIQEIDKLNVVIGTLEKDMLDIKAKYEKSVEERNVTGVQLIDRNDELCILYERSNQQQETLKNGEIELLRKEGELRLIRLQAEELRRQYDVARMRLPEISVNKQKILDLETQLGVERKRTEQLSLHLEDPQNLDRWRPLDGEDPDSEQLAAKVKVLETRLDQKREQLLEKQLVLEEVAALTERIRSQAVSKRESSKYLADQLNEFQFKIRDSTKKMLAIVSELSMYQATALRLQQERGHREKLLEEAVWRLDHGEAPFDEAVKEWTVKERRRIQETERVMRREEELALTQPAGALKTSAEPRPTAYIPDDIGIPKPYGNLAPFKPTIAGSTMKQHMRIPQIKDIEI